MYTGAGLFHWGLGDVDVVHHAGRYHLFHLVLPNHAYIAHAVSDDGLRWRRVENALFIGDPGAFDDEMLWTMHVSPDPDAPGTWRMFYTALSRAERGRVQRIGLARSDDLTNWTKVSAAPYPLEVSGPDYEDEPGAGPGWVSFRDPFFCRPDGKRWLLAAARVGHGPAIRRGCVALLEETGPGRFELHPPLFHPARYGEVEVPNLLQIAGRTYLIGSIREDVKVHYWVADSPRGPYTNFADNVLLPAGNYAARVSSRGDEHFLWSFFSAGGDTSQGVRNMLPPPKRLEIDTKGELVLRSFQGFDDQVERRLSQAQLTPLERQDHPRPAQPVRFKPERFGSDSGFKLFSLRGRYRSFRLRGRLRVHGQGKCGLAFRTDERGNGYFVGLDLIKGLAMLRAWGELPEPGFDRSFDYRPLQSNYFVSERNGRVDFELIAYGRYLELSLDGRILLTLADDRFDRGAVGFYAESAWLGLEELSLEELRAEAGEVCEPAGRNTPGPTPGAD